MPIVEDTKKHDMSLDDSDAISIDEKIEILSVEDSKIKEIGELLSNDSSRVILKLLFDDIMTANQIAQKTEISLSLVIYHLKKMQELNIIKVVRKGTNVKEREMKYYGITKFAIIILPSRMSKKARKSKSLSTVLRRIYRFMLIGIAAFSSWILIMSSQNPSPPLMSPIGIHGLVIPAQLLFPTVIALIVIIVGMIIERVLKAYYR